MRFTVDSNILVYAFDRSDAHKHEIASEFMIRAMVLDCVLTAQSVAEFLNVVRRKQAKFFPQALAQADRWTSTLTILETSGDHVLKGAEFASRHRLQLFDSIIWQVARSAHASLFVSEDLQDGLNIEGMRVINPFNASNGEELKTLLSEPEKW